MHKLKDFFFFLIQSEYGDLYKVMLEFNDDAVTELNCKYFDTIPVANSICVLKTGKENKLFELPGKGRRRG
jgi:splicing factor 3B subunit 3